MGEQSVHVLFLNKPRLKQCITIKLYFHEKQYQSGIQSITVHEAVAVISILLSLIQTGNVLNGSRG